MKMTIRILTALLMLVAAFPSIARAGGDDRQVVVRLRKGEVLRGRLLFLKNGVLHLEVFRDEDARAALARRVQDTDDIGEQASLVGCGVLRVGGFVGIRQPEEVEEHRQPLGKVRVERRER